MRVLSGGDRGGVAVLRRLAVVAAVVGCACVCPCFPADGQTVVAVVSDRSVGQYDQAVAGLKERLADGGLKVEYRMFDVTGLDLGRLESMGPEVIVTVGTDAFSSVAERVTAVPVVFCMVLEPPPRLLGRKNVTGVHLGIPLGEQLAWIKRVLPGAKKVGVIYNPAENGKNVEQAASACAGLGLSLSAVPMESAQQMPRVGEMGIDVLWLIPDTTVCQLPIVKQLLKESLQRKIPVMGLSPSYVRAGALFALFYDYGDIGGQAADKVLDVIKGREPSEVSVSGPRELKLYLNDRVAEIIGVQLPATVRRNAEIVQ